MHTWLHLLATVISVLALHLTATAEPVDSLYHAYLEADGQSRLQIVNAIGKEMSGAGITDTLYQCDKSTKPARQEAILHYLMAEYYFDQERYENALEQGSLARDLVMKEEQASKLQSDVLGLLSSAQYRLGDYDGALMTLLTAYRVDSDLKDQKLVSSDLNSLAAIYLVVEQPQQGIKFIEKAIELERKLKRPDRLAIRLGMASELYLMNKEFDKALAAIEEAHNIDKQAGNEEKTAIRLVQKGAVLESMGRLEEAQAALNTALPVLKQYNSLYSMAVGYNQLGSIEQKLGNVDKATQCYKKALEYSIKCGTPKTECTAERGLWETLRDSNPNVAMLHLERYSILNDSITKELISAQCKVFEATNENLEQTELSQKSEFFSKLITWGGILLGLLLLATMVGLFYSWRKGRTALKMAQQTEELRSHFFTNITNELQTPLTVMLNAGQQLLDCEKTSTSECKQLGEMIVNHGQNLLGLVNRLIDIDKTRSSIEPLDSKPGNIVMFVKMLVDNFTEAAQKQLVTLEFTSPMKSHHVVFVPDHIRKIVHGLIANALKFTPRNGSISVNLEAPEDDRMRLQVSDTGKGIPKEERDRIFEPFYQSVNGDDGVETGLGLSLANQLVKELNGSITVESELNAGTTFTIDFPVQAVEGHEKSDNEISLYAESRLRQNSDMKQKPLVFIVENNEDVAFFIASHLKADYNLRFARDGREALSNAQDLVPDLIITNITMPVMGGKELIRQVRSNSALSHIPIIAMTSSTSEQERISCIEAGADSVLVKPFNSDELRLLAKHLIRQQSKLRERFITTSKDVSSNDEAPVQRSREDQEFINKLVDVIHAQMAKDDIDMEHIAAALSLSRKQLRTRVMGITGLTPVAFVLQVRLNYARRIISTQNLSLTAVASKCGFQNLSHFSKAFKQQFGISPMLFRKNIDNMSNPKSMS